MVTMVWPAYENVPGPWTLKRRKNSERYRSLKARLHMRFFMRFRCDFDAILRTKPATAYPARVCSRVTLQQNTAKLAEIGKKGVLK